MEKIRIKIETVCPDCEGEGSAQISPLEVVTCSGCDGEGYQELYVNLYQLKNLLEGGSL